MSRHSSADHPQRFIDEIRAKQRNIGFPDGLANGAAMDKFLWQGSANPPLAQRIGAWIFGLTLAMMGVVFIVLGREDRSRATAFIGIVLIFLGIRVFRNGFRRRRKDASGS
jgi:hypothetical protein